MATSSPPDVRPGQVWASTDPRAEGRTVRVLRLAPGGLLARVVVLTLARNATSGAGRQHWVLVRRFRPTSRGYVLLADARRAPAAS